MDAEEVMDEVTNQGAKDIATEEDKKALEALNEEIKKEEKRFMSLERMRYQHYNFLRKRRKPPKGEQKIIKFTPIHSEEKDDEGNVTQKAEDIVEYFERCYKETGARPAPIGPVKKIPVNSQCICQSGKKYKKCCGRR